MFGVVIAMLWTVCSSWPLALRIILTIVVAVDGVAVAAKVIEDL